MTDIVKATINDDELLSGLGRTCFVESHGLSAPQKDIESYIDLKFTESVFNEELQNARNNFLILKYNGRPVGYSKTIFNCGHQNIQVNHVTKLERLYILKDYYNLKLGLELFNFNVRESVNYGQAGMWLFVWTENLRAYNFYQKTGFKIIGNHDFKISDAHSNPNYQMLLTY